MASNPWDKWFWNDWENDPELKLCSLAAQGLWMRMLCICAKADPKGYLLVAGRPLSPADLSSLVGKPEPEVETLLSELAHHSVFSRDKAARIYSRRMLRDEKKRKIARKNGKNGGNPTLRKEREISPSDNPPDNPEVKTHKPEARSHITNNTPDTLSGVSPPKPSQPEPKANPPPKRETRLPDAWEPSTTDREFAKSEGLTDADIDRTADKFRDYWAAKGGKSGRKADWPATWRNWVRRDVDERGQAGSGPRQNGQAVSGGYRREPASFTEAAMRYAARNSPPNDVSE